MIKKYLLIAFAISQITLINAESEYLLKEELFQAIAHRNETLRQFGRQITSDPFEEKIVSGKKNADSVTEKIKIFVTQQNNALSAEKQPQYLLKSEEKIQHLKKMLLAEQGLTNKSFSFWQLLSGLCTVSSISKIAIATEKNDRTTALANYIQCGIFGLIVIGLEYLKNDLQPGIDSCTNSTYTIGTLKMEIQQQQKNQSTSSNK